MILLGSTVLVLGAACRVCALWRRWGRLWHPRQGQETQGRVT